MIRRVLASAALIGLLAVSLASARIVSFSKITPSVPTVPASFFCMAEQLGFGDPAPNPAFDYNCLAKGTGVGWGGNVGNAIQPTATSAYDWSRNDLYVARVLALGSTIYNYNMGSVPTWARMPSSMLTTAQTTSGTDLTVASSDAAKVTIGVAITSGANITSGTYVASKPDATTLRLSAAVVGTIANGATLTFSNTAFAPTQAAIAGTSYTSGDDAMTQVAAAFCLRYKSQVTVQFEPGNELSEGALNQNVVNRGMWLAYRAAQIWVKAFQDNGCGSWIVTTPSLYSGTSRLTHYQAWFNAAADDPAGNGVNLINLIQYLTFHDYGPGNYYTNLLAPENYYVMRVNNSDSVMLGPAMLAIIPAAIANKPWVMTEGSWGTDGPGGGPSIGTGTADRTKQAAFTSRKLMLAWSKSVTRHYWYALTGNNGGVEGSSNWGQLELQNGDLVAAGTAWVATKRWMTGAYMIGSVNYTNTGTVTTSGNGVWSILWGRTSPANYRGLAIWDVGTQNSTDSVYGGSSTFAVPTSPNYVGYCQIDGTWTAVPGDRNVTIDMAPRLFETTRTSCLRRRRCLKSRKASRGSGISTGGRRGCVRPYVGTRPSRRAAPRSSGAKSAAA